MQICCERAQLLKQEYFLLELAIVLARVHQELKLAQWHCPHQPEFAYSWKRITSSQYWHHLILLCTYTYV